MSLSPTTATITTSPRKRPSRLGSASSGVILVDSTQTLRPQSIISTRPSSVYSTTTLYDSISSKDSPTSTVNVQYLRPRSISTTQPKSKYGRLSSVNELINPEEDEFISKIQGRLNIFNANDPFEYTQDYIQSLIPKNKNIYCKLPKQAPKEETITISKDKNKQPLKRKDSFSIFMEGDDDDPPFEGRRLSHHRRSTSAQDKKTTAVQIPTFLTPSSLPSSPKPFWANLFSFNFGAKAAEKAAPKQEPVSPTSRVRRTLGRPVSMHLPTDPGLALRTSIDTNQSQTPIPRKSFADFFSPPSAESSPASRQARALIQAGVTAFEHGELPSAAELFKIAAFEKYNTSNTKHGNNNVATGLAWYGYGMCLLHACGVPRDAKSGLRCLRNSAEAGEALGMFSLSMCYNQGLGCEEMEESMRKREMSKYLKLAADAGNTEAMVMILGYGEAEKKLDHSR